MWALQKTTNKSDDWGREREVRKQCQADCEREKRKKGEIITHRATCKTKYHLFVYKYSDFRVILLLRQPLRYY